MSEISIFLTLSFVIFASPYIAKFLRLPIAPTEIILGIIFKNIGILGESEILKLVAELGFYYLMFLAGTSVDLKLFFKQTRRNLIANLGFIFALYFGAFIGVFALNLSPIFIVVIPLMSVGLLSTLYKDYGLEQKWLNLAMEIGIIGELFSISCLTLLNAYLKFGISSDFFLNLAILGGFLCFITLFIRGLGILFWWRPQIKKILMPHFDKNEKDIRLSIAIFFLTIGVMMALNLEVVLGAFIAGTFLPTFFDHKKALPEKLSAFGYGFLIPIFFVFTGSTIDLGALLQTQILRQMLIITASIITLRVGIAWLIFRKNSAKIGLAISMPFTLLIATATMGMEAKFIDLDLYYAMIFASILEVIICLSLIKFLTNLKKT